MEKMKGKNGDPLKVFNAAISNVKPNIEVGRRLGEQLIKFQ